jgi:hypothetical protein
MKLCVEGANMYRRLITLHSARERSAEMMWLEG